MDEMTIINALVRWLHVGTAIVILGGTVFMRFVLMPAAEKLPQETHDELRGNLMRTWKKFVHIGVVLFLATGFYNYLAVMLPDRKGDSLYHALMGTKIILALVVIFLASVLVGRASAFEGLRQKRKTWLVVVILLALVVVAISSFLKVRGKKPASAQLQTSARLV
jgi:uncharacterized membrane protein